MLVLIGLLLTIFLGLLLNLLFIPKMHPLGRLGLAYILGLGILTVIMFIFLSLGIKLVQENLLVFLLITDFILFLLSRKKFKSYLEEFVHSSSLAEFSAIEKGVFMIILFLNIYVLAVSLYWPVRDWDALTLFDFRGKILANPESATAFMRAEFDGYYYGYPLLTSLAHSFVYLLGGRNPLFISSFFYISLTMLFYGTVREVSSKVISLLAVLLLMSNTLLVQHATAAYANLPYAVYYAMGTIYLFLWMTKKGKGYFLIASILTALSIWARDSEPFWLANFGVLVVYAFLKKVPFYPIFYILIVAPLRFIWGSFKDRVAVYVTSNQFRKSIFVILGNFNFQRFTEVISFLSGALFPRYLPIILFFFVILVLDIKNVLKNDRLYILLLIFSNLAVFVLGSYIFSFMFFDWIKIPSSAERVFMFFPALFIFYIVLVIGSSKKKMV